MSTHLYVHWIVKSATLNDESETGYMLNTTEQYLIAYMYRISMYSNGLTSLRHSDLIARYSVYWCLFVEVKTMMADRLKRHGRAEP